MPVFGHVFAQSPALQFTSHGSAAHVFAQPPLGQLQLPFEQVDAMRAAPPSRVSGMGGPPLGEASPPTDVVDPLQPTRRKSNAKERVIAP